MSPIGTIRRAVRRLQGVAPGPLILTYHRVIDLPPAPHNLCVSPRRFADQLEMLKSSFRIVPIAEIVEAIATGSSIAQLRGAAAITFDDGYADNLHNAKPLLERFDVPATIFIASGHVGHKRQFWWDELQELVLRKSDLVKELHAHIDGAEVRWDLSNASREARLELYRQQMYPRIQPMRLDEQRALLDSLWRQAGSQSTQWESYRTVTREELVSLASGGLVEIGAHTSTHAMLTAMNADEQLRELENCKAELHELTDRWPRSISYPYGQCGPETVSAARKAGYVFACAGGDQAVNQRSDRMALPRFKVKDWTATEFAERIWACISAR